MWKKPSRNFNVNWNGSPILEYPISNRLNVDVQFGIQIPGTISEYESFEACVEANLDLERWWNNDYTSEFMAYVVAWYRLRKSLSSHIADESMPKQKKK